MTDVHDDVNARYWASASDSEIEAAATRFFSESVLFTRSKSEIRFGSAGSKAVSLANGDRGKWFCFETNKGGYLTSPAAERNYTFRNIRDPHDLTGFEYCDSDGNVIDPPEAAPKAAAKPDTSRSARVAWSQGIDIRDTAAARYLAGRDILPGDDDLSEVMRFNLYKGRRQLLVAARTWKGHEQKGTFVALQRIFVNPDGTKDYGEDRTAKKVLGGLTSETGDAAFFIMRGSSTVCIHEGVEDALATRKAFVDTGHDAPTVVATFGVLRLEEAAATFPGAVFVADTDNLNIAEKAAKRAAGKVVWFNYRDCKDANEVLQAHGPDALVDAVVKAVPVRSALDEEERRDRQREDNRVIGDGAVLRTKAELLSLADMLERFVFVSDGSRVVDLLNPRVDLSFPDFVATYRASVEEIMSDGKTEKVQAAQLWKAHEQRHMAHTRTFAPGKDKFTCDPVGSVAVNAWQPYLRLEKSDSYDRHVQLFLQHIFYLFGEDTDRFLDWIAHIEQHPGVLPHTAWLHVSENTGTGRNALASILTRIWRGHVAASLDLMQLLNSGFNGSLSCKVLAVVDEIREGGRDHWEHSQKLKSLITEEQRRINPKYGREYVEFNSCRFLLLSNHRMALPLDENDRRFEAVMCTAAPRSEAYYAELYGAVDSPVFINDVAVWLGERDLSGFKPGRRAMATAAKMEIARASESEAMTYVRQLIEHWPADVIPSKFVALLISPDHKSSTSGYVRNVMSDRGIVSVRNPIKLDLKSTRVCILRNAEKWLAADGYALAREIRRGSNYSSENPRDELDRVVANLTESDPPF